MKAGVNIDWTPMWRDILKPITNERMQNLSFREIISLTWKTSRFPKWTSPAVPTLKYFFAEFCNSITTKLFVPVTTQRDRDTRTYNSEVVFSRNIFVKVAVKFKFFITSVQL